MITIKAAVAESKGAPFKIEELELDEPRPDEVLVRIVACGICQTDSMRGISTFRCRCPRYSATKARAWWSASGPPLRRSRPATTSCCLTRHADAAGNASAVTIRIATARRRRILAGARLDGSNGVHRRGGAGIAGDVHGHFFGQSSFATYALTTERNTVKVPDDVPLEILAPLGCGLQTGAGAVLNTFGMSPRESIAVFGTGAVGLAAVMAARVIAAGAIIAVDINAQRLALASELGATHTINPRDADVSRSCAASRAAA